MLLHCYFLSIIGTLQIDSRDVIDDITEKPTLGYFELDYFHQTQTQIDRVSYHLSVHSSELKNWSVHIVHM